MPEFTPPVITPVAVVAAPAASPTGLAIFKQGLLKVSAAIVGLAAAALPVLLTLPDSPWVTQAKGVCTSIIGIGAVLGIASQGIRKVGTDASDKVVTVDDALKVINK